MGHSASEAQSFTYVKDEESQGGAVFFLSYLALQLVPLDLRHPDARWGKGGGVIPRLFTALAFVHNRLNKHDFICKNSPFLCQRKGAGGMDW